MLATYAAAVVKGRRLCFGQRGRAFATSQSRWESLEVWVVSSREQQSRKENAKGKSTVVLQGSGAR